MLTKVRGSPAGLPENMTGVDGDDDFPWTATSSPGA